jgi:hypothetical protein
MANKYLKRGLVPVWDMAGPVTKKVPKLVTTNAQVALFVGSPVLYTAGYATAALATDDANVTGTVVALFDADGKPVNKLNGSAGVASSEAGYVEITYKEDQQYRITVDSTDMTVAKVGYTCNLLVSDGDGTTAAEANQTFSLAQLDGDKLANDAHGQLLVVGVVDRLDNAVATIGTEVLVKIEPTNYQAA